MVWWWMRNAVMWISLVVDCMVGWWVDSGHRWVGG